MHDLVIRHGTIIDPAQDLYTARDIVVQNGQIMALLESDSQQAAEAAAGC